MRGERSSDRIARAGVRVSPLTQINRNWANISWRTVPPFPALPNGRDAVARIRANRCSASPPRLGRGRSFQRRRQLPLVNPISLHPRQKVGGPRRAHASWYETLELCWLAVAQANPASRDVELEKVSRATGDSSGCPSQQNRRHPQRRLSKLFNPVFDPELTMNRRFIEQKRAPDAARQAAVLARHRRIDRLAAGDGYRSILFRCPSSTARSAFRHNRYGPIRWL
jgi:hypothetical protein